MKILQVIKYLLIAISVVTIALLFFINEDSAANIMLIWTYILLAIAIATLIVMPAINLAKNPKGALRSLTGLTTLVVIGGIFYALGSSVPVIGSDGKIFDSVAELKLSDTGLYLAYFALAAAVVVVLYGEVRNSFK